MMARIQKTVVVGMSGGVDSSTSAFLLKQQGYRVIGVYLHFWYEATPLERRSMSEERCCSIDGQADARRVARQIGIPFYTLNFSSVFKEKVVDYFLDSYQKGSTPNPCVTCNKQIKFGLFLEKAQEIFGADYIASGHYAQIEKHGSWYRISKGVDQVKDQTYFLYTLSQEQLAKVIFPVGHLPKSEVRKIAEENNLIVAHKGESQGLCFLREDRHYGFLERELSGRVRSGDIVDEKGHVLGTHRGLPLYTKGQRKGIEIGGTGPYYVVGMDHDKNVLFVSNNRFSPMLYSREVTLGEVSWTSGVVPVADGNADVDVRIRHGGAAVPSVLRFADSRVTIAFREPQRAVMKGQSAVVYVGDELLGGGVIEKAS
jgi:tRNA-uridine 2-sulfurtransferase